jgi:hypothetical protein
MHGSAFQRVLVTSSQVQLDEPPKFKHPVRIIVGVGTAVILLFFAAATGAYVWHRQSEIAEARGVVASLLTTFEKNSDVELRDKLSWLIDEESSDLTEAEAHTAMTFLAGFSGTDKFNSLREKYSTYMGVTRYVTDYKIDSSDRAYFARISLKKGPGPDWRLVGIEVQSKDFVVE